MGREGGGGKASKTKLYSFKGAPAALATSTVAQLNVQLADSAQGGSTDDTQRQHTEKVSLISWNACSSVLSDEASNWNEPRFCCQFTAEDFRSERVVYSCPLSVSCLECQGLGLNTTMVGYGYRQNSAQHGTIPPVQRIGLTSTVVAAKPGTQFQFQERRRRGAAALNDPVDEMTVDS